MQHTIIYRKCQAEKHDKIGLSDGKYPHKVIQVFSNEVEVQCEGCGVVYYYNRRTK
jgi:uncharacterized Zn finger protein